MEEPGKTVRLLALRIPARVNRSMADSSMKSFELYRQALMDDPRLVEVPGDDLTASKKLVVVTLNRFTLRQRLARILLMSP